MNTAADAAMMLATLTPRERDVLDGLAWGLPNKTIAQDLGISPRTAVAYRASLMTKLALRSLSDALRMSGSAFENMGTLRTDVLSPICQGPAAGTRLTVIG